MHDWMNLLRLFLSSLNVLGLLIHISLVVILFLPSSSELSQCSVLANSRVADDVCVEVDGGFGGSVHGRFLISFWCAAGSNDGVCLGVPGDVACWGLPTGSAVDLVSFNVGTILPCLLLVTQLVSYHTSLLVTPLDIVLVHMSLV